MSDDKPDQFDDKEWASLIDDWQAQPTKAIDTKALLRRIRRRSWVIWLSSMFDVIGVAAGWIFSIYSLIYGDFKPELSYLILVLSVLGTLIIVKEMQIRKGTWQHASEGNESVLDFSIKRCEVAIKIGRLFGPAIVSFMVVLLVWQGLVYGLLDKFYWKFMLWSVSWSAFVWLMSKWFIRRKLKELDKLNDMKR